MLVQRWRDRLKALSELMLLKSSAICALSAVFGVVMTRVFDHFSLVMISLIYGALMGGFFSLDCLKDIEADKIDKPGRPLPSGRLNETQALRFIIVLFMLSALFLTVLFIFRPSLQTLILTVLGLILAILYSIPPGLSRIPLLSHAIIASLFTIFPLLSGWGLFKPLGLAPFHIIGALFFLAWGDIEDLEDVEVDRIVGIKTLPVIIGFRRAALISSLINFLSVLIGIYDFFVHHRLYWLISLPLQLSAVLLILQLTRVDMKLDVHRIRRICNALYVSTGIILTAGYVFLS